MNIKFQTLTLQCRKSREVIEFSNQISFFHGQISSGKSSIARLIDFCLGGSFENTPALQKELVSVELSAIIKENEVLFEREPGSYQIQVSWRNEKGDVGSVLAPIQKGQKPIWEDNVYNISDLIFYFLNVTPLKVRRSKRNADSPLVRLSFKDIRWYCYLDQDHLDSSFYHLEDPHRKSKSRDVMRFLVGYYTEQLNDLEIKLDERKDERKGKLEAVTQIKSFLREFEYDSEKQIQQEIEQNEAELEQARTQLEEIHRGHIRDTHFADELRQRLRELTRTLQREEEVLDDLQHRVRQETALRAEILSTKFKLAKATEASLVLSGVRFECCPNCGSEINQQPVQTEQCPLCKNQRTHTEQLSSTDQTEIMRKDLTTRIEDIAESIDRHLWALRRQERIVEKRRQEKSELDVRLRKELERYDSVFLSQAREAERNVARLEERIKGLKKIAIITMAIKNLQEDADKIAVVIKGINSKIKEEKNGLKDARQYVSEIEDAYLEILNRVGVPGVSEEDKIRINLKTWEPSILPEGEDAFSYSFYNAGSGGKKTLLNVCYALAVHKVATENSLPLPTYLIIDTPMKNIGEDVNRDIFESFYQLIYELSAGPLRNTQFIIIDKEYIEPDDPEGIDIFERFMTPDDPGNPPLISYYRGP